MKQVREYLKNTRVLLFIICFFALLLRLWLFLILQPWDEHKVLIGDGHGDHLKALNIVDSRSLSSRDASRTPGYILFLALIYILFGVKPWLVLILQIFLDIGIVLIVFFIAKEILKSESAALIAAALYSISFPSAYYSARLLSEISFTFVLALAVLIFIKSLKGNRLWGFALAGFLVGIATYIRPVALYFPAVLLFVLLFSRTKFAVKLRNMLIVFIVFSAVLFPWQYRNLKVYSHYALTSKHGQNLIEANIAIVKARLENISRYEATDLLIGDSLKEVTNPFEESKILQKIALGYLAEHPLEYMKYHLEGIVKMFLGTTRSGIADVFGIEAEPPASIESLSETAQRIIGNLRREFPTLILFIKQMLEYLFLIIGMVIMCSTKDERLQLFFLVLIIFYFANLTGVIGYSRFRVPIIPFYLVISAKGIFETFKFVEGRCLAC